MPRGLFFCCGQILMCRNSFGVPLFYWGKSDQALVLGFDNAASVQEEEEEAEENDNSAHKHTHTRAQEHTHTHTHTPVSYTHLTLPTRRTV